jgi:hypothetical protein
MRLPLFCNAAFVWTTTLRRMTCHNRDSNVAGNLNWLRRFLFWTEMRTALFCDITQRVVLIYLLPRRRRGITTTCCVTSQKSGNLIYFAAEAWNLSRNKTFRQLCCLSLGEVLGRDLGTDEVVTFLIKHYTVKAYVKVEVYLQSSLSVPWLRPGQSPASYSGRQGSIPCQSLWDFCWAGAGFAPSTSVFPCHYHSTSAPYSFIRHGVSEKFELIKGHNVRILWHFSATGGGGARLIFSCPAGCKLWLWNC